MGYVCLGASVVWRVGAALADTHCHAAHPPPRGAHRSQQQYGTSSVLLQLTPALVTRTVGLQEAAWHSLQPSTAGELHLSRSPCSVFSPCTLPRAALSPVPACVRAPPACCASQGLHEPPRTNQNWHRRCFAIVTVLSQARCYHTCCARVGGQPARLCASIDTRLFDQVPPRVAVCPVAVSPCAPCARTRAFARVCRSRCTRRPTLHLHTYYQTAQCGRAHSCRSQCTVCTCGQQARLPRPCTLQYSVLHTKPTCKPCGASRV